VAIVAHRTTRAFLRERGQVEVAKQKAAVEEGIELRRGWLASGSGPGGVPLTEADRESLHGSLALRTAYLGELDSLRLVVPDVTFDDAMEIDLGDRVVRLLHVGPAHTPGDVVAYLPGSRILAAGDVVEEGALWLEGADVRGWAQALERLRRLELSAVVPGHGSLVLGRSILDVQGGFLDAVVAWAGTGGGASAGAAATSPGACADATVPLPSDVAVYREAFSSWGVDEEAFQRMAREACGGASK
jgi:glyoxylase-like metal-dependent hydrolase (beta-lactamase superfamily II)